ncbi:MAG: hypothetical protein IKE91_07245 [Clostridia bacterium]|nr:hypothetical protein [Clostridia bacterium]
MKKDLLKRITLVLAFIIIIVGIIVFLSSSKGIQQEEFSNSNYSVKYDTTWKISESLDNEIVFVHNDTQSTIDISIADLDSNLYGKTLKQIAQNVKNKIEKEYPDYKCISEHITYLNDDISEAYQLLFEDGKRQSLIQIGMYGYKVFISNYTAENQYFDILLDSVQTINANFKIKYESVDMMDSRKIEETGYEVKTDDVDYSQTETHSYIGSNYKVTFSVPVQFKGNVSGLSYTKESGDGSSTRISITSENENLFTVYDEVMKNSKSYNYTKIEIQKIANGYLEGYGIKGTTNYGREVYTMLYALNDFNTLQLTVSGDDVTQNMIDNIKIVSFDRCGNYIDRTSVDGYLVGTLTQENYFSMNDKQTYISVDYKVPEKYKEIVEQTYDLGAPERARAFVIGKLRNSEITESTWATDSFYDYNVTINIALGSAETIANNDNLTYKKDVTIGDVTYKYYTSEYDSEGTTIKEAYYIASINGDGDNAKYSFRIYVSSLDDIPESVLQDFASVKIEVQDL